MAKRRKFSRDFKVDVLRQSEHRPVAEVARENDIHPTLINRWIREQRQYPQKAFQGNGNQYKMEAEIKRLQEHIGKLYAEKELLKKSIETLEQKRAEEQMTRSSK